MKRTTYLTVACLLGGLMMAVLVSGLGTSARAAKALQAPIGMELLQNPGFESATGGIPDNWSKYGGTLLQTNAPVHGGSYAAQFDSDTTSTKWVFQVVTVTEGTAYIFSAWALKNDTNIDEVYLRVSWYTSPDGSGSEMSHDDSTTILLSDDPAYRFLTTDPLPAPTGAQSARARLVLNPVDATPCTAYFDDASFQQAGAPELVPDLGIVKTGPATVDVGDPITYHLTLANVGTITATDVRITDTLPTGVSFIAQTGPFTFTRLGQTLTWDAGNVAVGALHHITVTGRVAGAVVPTLTLTNRVTATTTATETVTANNTNSWDTTVTVPDQADLVVVKAGPAVTTPGTQIVYHIALSNTGTITATDVRLTDTLPAAVDFVTQTSSYIFDRSGHRLVWQLGDVLTGARHLITITAQVSDSATFTLTNRITATTTASETITDNNTDTWMTAVDTKSRIYLPLVLRNYVPPSYGMIVEAVLYDGWQTSDYDEAVLLLNGGDGDVDLSGWELCKMGASDWSCTDLPTVTVASHQRLWLARSEMYFAASFGFAPDHTLSGWPALSNSGDEVVLRDAEGQVQDALVYEAGNMNIDGWDGIAVQPYDGSNFAKEGQVLYRVLDEETGLSFDDTDTAAAWAQHTDDPWHGQRARYPGWDLEQFFQPALGTTGTVTVGITPDNAYQVVADAIRSAEESIELELYTLEHYGLVTALVQKAQQGVSVTVLLEGDPVGGVEDQELWACEQLHGTGYGLCYFMVNSDPLNIYDRYSFVHAKFMVVDQERLLVGSQNLTFSSLSSRRRQGQRHRRLAGRCVGNRCAGHGDAGGGGVPG